MPWADRDRHDSPKEKLVYNVSSTPPTLITGRAPSAGAAKHNLATEYVFKRQQREQPEICAQSGLFQGFNPVLGRDANAIDRVLPRVKAVGICPGSFHKRPEGEQWFRCEGG